MTLPSGTLPAGIQPVHKELFIDLLDPDFGLQNNDARAIAEKIEGLAWGPDLRPHPSDPDICVCDR